MKNLFNAAHEKQVFEASPREEKVARSLERGIYPTGPAVASSLAATLAVLGCRRGPLAASCPAIQLLLFQLLLFQLLLFQLLLSQLLLSQLLLSQLLLFQLRLCRGHAFVRCEGRARLVGRGARLAAGERRAGGFAES